MTTIIEVFFMRLKGAQNISVLISEVKSWEDKCFVRRQRASNEY